MGLVPPSQSASSAGGSSRRASQQSALPRGGGPPASTLGREGGTYQVPALIPQSARSATCPAGRRTGGLDVAVRTSIPQSARSAAWRRTGGLDVAGRTAAFTNPPPPPSGRGEAVKYKSSEGRRSRQVSDRVVPPPTVPPKGALVEKRTGQARIPNSAGRKRISAGPTGGKSAPVVTNSAGSLNASNSAASVAESAPRSIRQPPTPTGDGRLDGTEGGEEGDPPVMVPHPTPPGSQGGTVEGLDGAEPVEIIEAPSPHKVQMVPSPLHTSQSPLHKPPPKKGVNSRKRGATGEGEGPPAPKVRTRATRKAVGKKAAATDPVPGTSSSSAPPREVAQDKEPEQEQEQPPPADPTLPPASPRTEVKSTEDPGAKAGSQTINNSFDLNSREEDFMADPQDRGMETVDEAEGSIDEYDLDEALDQSLEDLDEEASEHSSDQMSPRSRSPDPPPASREIPGGSGLPLHQGVRKECFIACPYTGTELQIILPHDVHSMPLVDTAHLYQVDATLQRYITSEYDRVLTEATDELLTSWGVEYNGMVTTLQADPSYGVAPRTRRPRRSRAIATQPSTRAGQDAPPGHSSPVKVTFRSPIRPPVRSPDPQATDPLGLEVPIERQQEHQDDLRQALKRRDQARRAKQARDQSRRELGHHQSLPSPIPAPHLEYNLEHRFQNPYNDGNIVDRNEVDRHPRKPRLLEEEDALDDSLSYVASTHQSESESYYGSGEEGQSPEYQDEIENLPQYEDRGGYSVPHSVPAGRPSFGAPALQGSRYHDDQVVSDAVARLQQENAQLRSDIAFQKGKAAGVAEASASTTKSSKPTRPNTMEVEGLPIPENELLPPRNFLVPGIPSLDQLAQDTLDAHSKGSEAPNYVVSVSNARSGDPLSRINSTFPEDTDPGLDSDRLLSHLDRASTHVRRYMRALVPPTSQEVSERRHIVPSESLPQAPTPDLRHAQPRWLNNLEPADERLSGSDSESEAPLPSVDPVGLPVSERAADMLGRVAYSQTDGDGQVEKFTLPARARACRVPDEDYKRFVRYNLDVADHETEVLCPTESDAKSGRKALRKKVQEYSGHQFHQEVERIKASVDVGSNTLKASWLASQPPRLRAWQSRGP